MDKFCVEGVLQNPKCYKTETFDFPSEEQIFDILLDLLKSELPPKLQLLKDCQDKPMFISEKNIDIIPTNETAKFKVLLNPLSDVPNYNDNLNFRTVDYNFELILTVTNQLARCVTWELLRFKNAIEGLIIGAEFAIDGYNSVAVEPKGFQYYVPEQVEEHLYLRQGTYRFTVTVTQYQI